MKSGFKWVQRCHYLDVMYTVMRMPSARPLIAAISGLEGTFKLFNLYTKQSRTTAITPEQSKQNMSPYNIYP